MQKYIGKRPVWLAASTHEGEEEKIAEAHKILSKLYPDILTIIVPRHHTRSEEIAAKISKHGSIAIRSRGERIGNAINFYLADTMGELGLFYRLSEIVFMGGSIVPRGGQNPLEPLRLRCAVIAGNYTDNFAEMYSEMEKIGICERANTPTEIADKIMLLLRDSDARVEKQAISKEWLKTKSGAINRILSLLAPIFAPID